MRSVGGAERPLQRLWAVCEGTARHLCALTAPAEAGAVGHGNARPAAASGAGADVIRQRGRAFHQLASSVTGISFGGQYADFADPSGARTRQEAEAKDANFDSEDVLRNEKILETSTPAAFVDLYAKHGQYFTQVNRATAIMRGAITSVRLAMMHRDQGMMHEVMQTVSNIANDAMDCWERPEWIWVEDDLQAVSNSFYGLGILRENLVSNNGDVQDIRQLERVARRMMRMIGNLDDDVINLANAQDCSMIVWSTVKCFDAGRCVGEGSDILRIFSRMAHPENLAQAVPQTLSNALWALACHNLHPRHRELVAVLDQCLMPDTLADAGGINLGNVLWGCAKLRFKLDAHAINTLLHEMTQPKKITELTANEASKAIRSVAKLMANPADLDQEAFGALLRCFLSHVSGARPIAAATVLHALADLRIHPGNDVLEELSALLVRGLDDLPPQAVANAIYSWAVLKYRPPREWLDLAMSDVSRMLILQNLKRNDRSRDRAFAETTRFKPMVKKVGTTRQNGYQLNVWNIVNLVFAATVHKYPNRPWWDAMWDLCSQQNFTSYRDTGLRPLHRLHMPIMHVPRALRRNLSERLNRDVVADAIVFACKRRDQLNPHLKGAQAAMWEALSAHKGRVVAFRGLNDLKPTPTAPLMGYPVDLAILGAKDTPHANERLVALMVPSETERFSNAPGELTGEGLLRKTCLESRGWRVVVGPSLADVVAGKVTVQRALRAPWMAEVQQHVAECLAELDASPGGPRAVVDHVAPMKGLGLVTRRGGKKVTRRKHQRRALEAAAQEAIVA
ncbi:unnamed protein product [Pedinophyceae sp. YPF-701]|nr:unnamed protein product [Pedinophyceae sp. YPF-701]